mgnify:CR=1 FL=1
MPKNNLAENFLTNFNNKKNLNKKNVINDYIFSLYKEKINIKKIINTKSKIIDHLIKKSWQENNLQLKNISLIAVGGYGRGELFPHSDIDILILINNYENKETLKNIENFIAEIWYFKTIISHSVRTSEDCIYAVNNDITIYTSLLESRLIIGDKKLYNNLKKDIDNKNIWTKKKFLLAKKEEKINRYNKYSNTGYLLEPNIKEGPGGFRDLQTLIWVAKRNFGINSLLDLYKKNIITKKEYSSLICSEKFLSKVRFLLHFMRNKPEERLYFSNQKKLADYLGYQASKNIGVEKFMQNFYKHITSIKQLNEILIKYIENTMYKKDNIEKIIINNKFYTENDVISTFNKNVFIENPSNLLEIFLIRNSENNLLDISAKTIRDIRECLYLIDNNFRNNPANKRLFMSIFFQKNGIARCLRKMNDYGVLEAYLKPFSRVVGMMQFDLFHIYTVDEHTLSVLSNTRYMDSNECKIKYTFVYEIFKKLLSPEILYLGAIFHDIGKGRKGDHSKVGCAESLIFCETHGMNKHQSEMVSWLVENHLLMSLTIQKKDISNSDVIKEFANKVKTQERLDYLYLLTIADIRGTNPELYTDWKDSLLKELYISCKNYFRKNTFDIKKPDRYIKNLKKSVETILSKKINKKKLETIWSFLNTDYFRRHSYDEIAWHIEIISQNSPNNAVAIRERVVKGCTELTIYQNSRKNIFSYIANIIDNLNISIVDARIITLKNNQALDTYLLLDMNGRFIKDKHTLNFLSQKINEALNNPNYKISKITKKQTENIASFEKFINLEITKKEKKELLIEITTLDHPGLLSKICESLDSCDLIVKDAKISTLGEEANDIFSVVTTNNKACLDNYIEKTKNNIKQKISELYN